MEEKKVGPYTLLKNLGKGGMGEVFLAKDPFFGRNVALKKIRQELKENATVRSRFLREAEVASALTHPSIIPILSIETSPPEIYYTMPYIEGKTLRQILKEAKTKEKLPPHDPSPSIPFLTRIFLQVCEAMAYTHAKGILHRDLKPENIMIGKYGEVMIFDWGIADFIQVIGDDEVIPLKSADVDLTRPGKIAGTLAYMAPERLFGKASSLQTDIYALGVILYQLLTFELPFQRKSLNSFRKSVHIEQLIDPLEMAPYRDIPHELAAVVKKCLATKEEDRYGSLHELIIEIKSYVEGMPRWICLGHLQQENTSDWQIQENILLAKHSALMRSLETSEWAAMMVSKRSFTENLRLDTEVKISHSGEGLGILLNLPLADQKRCLEEGYCLWLGSSKNPSCRLFRNNVQVMEVNDIFLDPDTWYHIRIEKIEERLKFFLNGQLKLSFTSFLPFAGSHIGLLFKDGEFSLKEITLYDGSRNVLVNCLAVPNAFLSHQLFDLALKEYQRIGQCFPGRLEGREALFRSGLTLLEKGKYHSCEEDFYLALKEFEQLRHTPGAPLEYLGKSLVYQVLKDPEEEAKCLELLLRKYPKHPLLSICKEHIIYRLHETSLNDRAAAYRIILLSLRHIPELLDKQGNRLLIETLQENWEPLLFIEPHPNQVLHLAIQLAFWLKKIPILLEIAESIAKQTPLDETLLANTLYCLIELNAHDKIKEFLSIDAPKIQSILAIVSSSHSFPHNKKAELYQSSSEIPDNKDPTQSSPPPLAQELLQTNDKLLPKRVAFGSLDARGLYYLMKKALNRSEFPLFLKLLSKAKKIAKSPAYKEAFDALEVWYDLLHQKLPEASAILRKYSPKILQNETSPLYFAYGTWLYLMQGAPKALLHFSSALETSHPSTTVLPAHFVSGNIDEHKEWNRSAFWWEKQELARQLDLFYHAIGTK